MKMSIIKSIMHKFNGTDYDTLHPETEHAQVTDFGQGVVTHLLASTLASTVTAVTSGSLFGKMVQLLLTATGCKYLMDQNGYICFGSLFGGLILQWRYVTTISTGATSFTFPIAFTNQCYLCIPYQDEAVAYALLNNANCCPLDKAQFYAASYNLQDMSYKVDQIGCFAIGN
jgi:hypothetical protein